MGTASRAAADTGEQRLLSSIRMHNRSGETPGAAMRTSNWMSRGPALTGSPEASDMPNIPRASERLLANTSSIASSNPAAAAPIAIRVARQDASPARNSHPGVTCSPLPPSSVGMSVNSCVPLVWVVTTRVPLSTEQRPVRRRVGPPQGDASKPTRRVASLLRSLVMPWLPFIADLTLLIVAGSVRNG